MKYFSTLTVLFIPNT